MRWLVLLFVAALPGCATPRSTELRVVDPWQIAVEKVTSAGTSPLLPANVRQRGDRCELRDDEGFPHFCDFGDFLLRNDGTLVVAGTPAGDAQTMRLRATLFRCTTCHRRGWSRCTAHFVDIEFVTPWSNVAVLQTRAGPIRSLELPAGAIGN